VKIKKATLEKIIHEELEKILKENTPDSIQSAEDAFENLLDEAKLTFFYRNGKFYLTLPQADMKNTEKDPEMRQQNTLVIDVVGYGTSENDIDI
jgi:hypothetical protein